MLRRAVSSRRPVFHSVVETQDMSNSLPVAPSFDQQVTFLYVADLAISNHFYEDVLGLAMVLDEGACRIYRVAGEAFIGLCRNENRKVDPEGVTVTFVTNRVDYWYERLIDHGVTVEGPPKVTEEFKIYNFFARDPDGARLEFQKFLDPVWPEAGT